MAKVLGKLSVPGRPTNMDYSRARAYYACSGCGWGLFGHFTLVYHFSFLSLAFWEMARYRLKYCLRGPLSPKQPTDQPFFIMMVSCVLLESPRRGDSNEYAQYTIFKNEKENHPKLSQICSYGIFSKGLMNEFETAVANEPSVFEPLKLYCNSVK